MSSVWEIDQKEYPRLDRDIERDTVVIGGGIAGYLAAFRLTEAGESVTLIEADRLFSGTTGRTTAKITYNQGSVYSELRSHYGRRVTALYYRAQTEGMRGYRELVEKYNIDCDWEETDGYIFSAGDCEGIESQCEALREAGADCELVAGAGSVNAACAVKARGQYLFHPLKFLNALPVDFEIFEHTRAVEIDAEKKLITTDCGVISAKRIVVATRYPIINSHGGYIMRVYQSLSYTVAVDNRGVDEMYLDTREDGLSLRPYAGGTLLGGGDHRSGRNKTGGKYEGLEKRAAELFEGAEVTRKWHAEDCMTFDGIPYVGQYAPRLTGVYVITGFNKWGMTNAMTAASVITSLITGKDNEFAELYSPSRKMRGTFGKFLANACVNMAGILLGYLRVTFRGEDSLQPGEGRIVRYKGKRRAVYRDFDDALYAIGRMCPHMHCELRWNSDTRTWDCPCHGSSFDIYGNLLEPPSVKHARLCEEDSEK